MKIGHGHLLTYGLIVILITLVACSVSPKKLFSTKLDGLITVSEEANPDQDGRPSPVVIRFYELKSTEAFENIDFFTLYDEEATTLGGDLVAREELELAPGATHEFRRKPHEDTRYLGVITAFRNIEQAQWRDILKLELNEKNSFVIEIGSQTVAFKRR